MSSAKGQQIHFGLNVLIQRRVMSVLINNADRGTIIYCKNKFQFLIGTFGSVSTFSQGWPSRVKFLKMYFF